MGAVELCAALLGVVTILLVVRRSMWNFPFALAMVSLYFFVFWDARLYSDALLQLFFFAINLYGWWNWSRAHRVYDGVAVAWMSGRARALWLGGTVAAVIAWGSAMARFTDAVAPLADAAVAAVSVAAQLLQSLRRVESWMLWIAVDSLAIGLFTARGLTVTAALYTLFLVLAVVGLVQWKRKVTS
jgi:nicotinamide mononucleotide transporter